MKHSVLLALSAALLVACQPKDVPAPKPETDTPTKTTEVTGPVFLSAANVAKIAESNVAPNTWKVLNGAYAFDPDLISVQGNMTDETVAVALVGDKANTYRVYPDRAISAGDTVSVTLSLSGAEGTSALILLARHCDSTPYEDGRVTVELTPEPQDVTLSKTFEQDHACYRVQVSNVKDASEGAVAVWSID